jgi:hypothetical protein
MLWMNLFLTNNDMYFDVNLNFILKKMYIVFHDYC